MVFRCILLSLYTFFIMSRAYANNDPSGVPLSPELREKVFQALKKEHFDESPLMKDLVQRLLVSRYLSKLSENLFSSTKISDEEVRAAYKKNPVLRLSRILLDSKDPKKAQKKARSIILQLQSLEKTAREKEFKKIAQKSSIGFEAPTGGDLDYKELNSLGGAIIEAVSLYPLEPGLVGKPIHTEEGVVVLYIRAIQPLDAAQMERVRLRLSKQRVEALITQYLGRL